MKKKFCLFICLLCTALFFSACSKESKGVPDSVVLRDTSISMDQNVKYTIEHNVDTAAHIDNLQLITEHKGKYGTKTLTTPYTYIYDKSTDIWTLINEGYTDAVCAFNEDAYVDTSPFTGDVSTMGYSYKYAIVFQDIDSDNMTADIDCYVHFDNADIPDIAKPMIVKLDQYDQSFNVVSEYEYTLGGITLTKEIVITFKLGIDYGLLTYEELVSGEGY